MVEDVLTSGLSAKLMRYLRMRVMGEVNSGQKDPTFASENKQTSSASSLRCREDSRRRFRPVADVSRSEPLRPGDEISSVEQSNVRDRDQGSAIRIAEGEEFWSGSMEILRPEADDSSVEINKEVEQLDDKCGSRDSCDGRSRVNERHGPNRLSLDEDVDDNDARRRMNRGMMRFRGRGRGNDGNLDGEQLTSPGRIRGRNFPRNDDSKIPSLDVKNSTHQVVSDCIVDRDYNEDRFRDCCIGSRDISDLVKKAIEAAEAEARVADAPLEAVKAAGDAAAELVKTSALEVSCIDKGLTYL